MFLYYCSVRFCIRIAYYITCLHNYLHFFFELLVITSKCGFSKIITCANENNFELRNRKLVRSTQTTPCFLIRHSIFATPCNAYVIRRFQIIFVCIRFPILRIIKAVEY